MVKVILRKRGKVWEPADDAAREQLAKASEGLSVIAEVRKPRNIKHHRLFFALLNKVHENLDIQIAKDTLRKVILIRIGECDVIRTKKGDIEIAKSIAFESMAQDEFNDLFQRTVDFVCAEVIPGMDHLDLMREVMEMVGENQ